MVAERKEWKGYVAGGARQGRKRAAGGVPMCRTWAAGKLLKPHDLMHLRSQTQFGMGAQARAGKLLFWSVSYGPVFYAKKAGQAS